MNRKFRFTVAMIVSLVLSIGMVVPLISTIVGIHTNVSTEGNYAPVEYVVYPFIFFALGVIGFYLYSLGRQIHEALVLSAVVWPIYLWIDLWLLSFTIVSGHRSRIRLGLEIAGVVSLAISGVYLAKKDRPVTEGIR